MNQLCIHIITHPFTSTSYYPFEVIHLDHIELLTMDAQGNKLILVLMDAFSRWVELIPISILHATALRARWHT